MTTQDNQTTDAVQEEIISEIIDTTNQSTTQDDSLVAEVARLKDALARSQADYQNLVMRGERDRADMVSFLSAKILLPLLSQIDTLERAIKLKEGVSDDAFVEGIRSLHAGFQKYLDAQGVKSFESIGQEVDPDKHDVMTQGPGEEGKIISEFEKGYMIGDRVLRHARVVVGSGE